MTIVYGCCVGSWNKASRYVIPHITGPLITMHNQTSIASAYNAIIQTVRGSSDVEALVLLHDDLEIIDDNFEHVIRDTLAQEDIGIIGVAGAKGVKSLAWWNYSTVGFVISNTMTLDFGVRSADVDALDGCILVLSPWAIEHLMFDTRYNGFHGYDCDITRQVLSHNKRAVVIDTCVYHHTPLGWKSSQIHQSWLAADKIYREKWNFNYA